MLIYIFQFFVIGAALLQYVVQSEDVVILDDVSVLSEVEQSSSNWFIKFHAPWCSHCKKLNPTFDQLGQLINGTVRLGSVDVTKNPLSASRYNVTRFPTIIYKKGSIYGTFDGERSLNGFISFLDRLNHKPVLVKSDILDMDDLYHSFDDLVFVLTTNTINNDMKFIEYQNSIIKAFYQTAEKLHLHAAFTHLEIVSANILHKHQVNFGELSISKLEKGRNVPIPMELMRDDNNGFTKQIEEFIKYNNYGIITKLDNHNYSRLTKLHKTLIIAILTTNQDMNDEIITNFQSSILDFDVNLIKNYIFCQLDGKRWVSFVKSHGASVPSILILDGENDEHQTFKLLTYDITSTSEESSGELPLSGKISVNYINAIIKGVIRKTIIMKQTHPPNILTKIKHRFNEHYPWSILILLFPFILVILAIFPVFRPEELKIKKA
eukprot:gene16221-22070_t